MNKTRKLQFTVTIEFDDEGRISREEIEANLNFWLEKARMEGGITPDDEGHAMLTNVDVTPA